MRRSSSIRCLSAVIGETSVTDENINRRDHNSARSLAEQSTVLTKSESEDGTLLKLPLAA
jgi:hypothetical protein